ncbi:UDP-glucose 4-epimerase GalE [Microvirga pudoricolor]|uniref:UDP-glucose 4-epimerase GalE n=1 Tax=Microvirga pudoricolor TaxID=2778729 RepID=UPI00194E33BF|nr:UDP-glucose 4-epimerase GalE [Microvirga pudoricolor]MBM6594408.1 UDP-glucose 4-epimerase GalE [Microvirga pudoricolor]
MARFLVTGGAGYVGSHTVLALHERGDDVVVVDDLSMGHRGAVPKGVELVVEDLGNQSRLREIFAGWTFDGVLHFAARSLVGESMREPLHYLAENVNNTLRVAEAAIKSDCKRFVLSSTAALFGMPDRIPIDEESLLSPISPYGESKLMAEKGLEWAGKIHGLHWTALRYFNAAGADPEGRLGEDHTPETHLIPLAINAALGLGPELTVFGDTYETPDGTAVRDYVHVTDLADAHLRVLDRLALGQGGRYNVGNGTGYSVLDVIKAVERVSGRKVPHKIGPQRPGDPPVLLASNERLIRDTGWKPRFDKLEAIVETAWRWRSAHPAGFETAAPLPIAS